MDRFKYIIWILVSAWFIISCTEEDTLNYKEKGTEQTGMVKLHFSTPATTNVTIARSSEISDDYLVKDLYIYVFDAETGELITIDETGNIAPAHFEGDKLLDGIVGAQELITNAEGKLYNSSWIRFKIAERGFGTDVYIYMIANASLYTDNILSSENKDLKLIRQKSELDELIHIYNQEIQPNRTNFLMSGNTDPTQGIIDNSGNVYPVKFHITENGTIVRADYKTEAYITLERAEAKVRFNFKKGANAKGTFTPETYRIHNYPLKSYSICKYYLQAGFGAKIKGKDASRNKDDFLLVTSDISIEDPSSFTFYMPENLKYPGEEGGTMIGEEQSRKENGVGYKEREKRDDDGNWINAPDFATYVEVTGTYAGEASGVSDKEVTAKVTYFIHLGFSKYMNNEYYVNDYFVQRNYEYIYNIEVNGIDDIITEVITNNDKTPAEGIITLEPETVEITTENGNQKLPLHPKETLEKESPEDDCSWFTLNVNTEIETWIENKEWWDKNKAQNFNFKAKYPFAAGEPREVVLIAKRESADKRSIIKRRIIFKQVPE